MKIWPVGTEFHTDGLPERHDEADSHVSQFVMYNGELRDIIFTR